MPEEVLRLLAMWALAHELADDAWRAAVERGQVEGPEPPDQLDSLAALVAAEKDALREALESGDITTAVLREGESLEGLRFEIGELRGRMESMEATLESIARKLGSE